MQPDPERAFTKMHGLGNDFVVVDARARPFPVTEELARRVADRREGVGCDQLVVIRPAAPGSGADVAMHLRNADGGEIAACGNATRCVAARLMTETGTSAVTIATRAGLLHAKHADGGRIAVDMGPPGLRWDDIPLAREQDTLALDLGEGELRAPVAVSMGNPHAVFFVPEVEPVPLADVGPVLEHDPLFPERANISVVQVLDRDHLRLRVWERGAGITRACGTAACAAAVAAVRRGDCDRHVTVTLDGGDLHIEWRETDGHVMMAGPVAESFTGRFSEALVTP
jgi:diaminopimelate epimerase